MSSVGYTSLTIELPATILQDLRSRLTATGSGERAFSINALGLARPAGDDGVITATEGLIAPNLLLLSIWIDQSGHALGLGDTISAAYPEAIITSDLSYESGSGPYFSHWAQGDETPKPTSYISPKDEVDALFACECPCEPEADYRETLAPSLIKRHELVKAAFNDAPAA